MSTQSKDLSGGIIGSASNLSEAAEAAAAAPHFNMKVPQIFHIICRFSNACICIFPLREEVRKAAIEDKHKGVKNGKKLSKVARCTSSVSTFQPGKFTGMKLSFFWRWERT